MASLLRLLRSKWIPLVETTDKETFAGKTVLITGATGGLGLEAAKKLANLGCDRLIITARDEAKGERAKAEIKASMKDQKTGKVLSDTEIYLMQLDMASAEGVKTFAAEVTQKFSRIDAAILNAGVVQASWKRSVDGFEEMLQVNTVSTTLLGLLLLPKLIESASAGGSTSPTHLTFVSSGTAVAKKPEAMEKYYESPNVLQTLSEEKEFPGGQPGYGTSKLLLEYSVRHIAKLPALQDGRGGVKVIVNSVCPGMCKSDLGRQYTTNYLSAILIWVLLTLFARTAEQGSNSYISALTRDAKSQGQLWKDDKYYDPGQMITSPEGQKLSDKVWKELVKVVEDADSSVTKIIEGS